MPTLAELLAEALALLSQVVNQTATTFPSLLSTLQAKARLYLPEIADLNALSDSDLLILLNDAAREFLKRSEGYPTSTTFTATAEQGTYVLSTVTPYFSHVQADGLWWYNGSQWWQLEAYTQPRLSQEFPFWRSTPSGTPRRYVLDGNSLLVHPTPNTTRENAFELFHFARSIDATAASNCVFTNSNVLQLVHLIEYLDILFDYLRAKIAAMQNKPALATDWMNVFYARCEEARQQLKARPDLSLRQRPAQAGWAMRQAVAGYAGSRR